MHTTDIRTITSRDIALDPTNGPRGRLIANVLEREHDGSLRIHVVNGNFRAFYKDGHLFIRNQSPPKDLGPFQIVWQGRLLSSMPHEAPRSLGAVNSKLKRGFHNLVRYEDMTVEVRRGAITAALQRLIDQEPEDEATLDLIRELTLAAQ